MRIRWTGPICASESQPERPHSKGKRSEFSIEEPLSQLRHCSFHSLQRHWVYEYDEEDEASACF